MAAIRSIARLMAVLIVIACIGGGVIAVQQLLPHSRELSTDLLSNFDTPADPADNTTRVFTVRSGETAASIASRLQSDGLVQHAEMFRLLADGEGVASDLAAGDYELSPSMRPSEILGIIAKGKTKALPMVTIPEGLRAEEIAERLAASHIGTADQFLSIVRAGTTLKGTTLANPPGSSLEGYLFPDSYQVDSKTTSAAMVERMVGQFNVHFTAKLQQEAKAQGLTVHQAVVLASIIEREAVVPSERKIMSGVFHNRLNEGMRLQSDPTVQYAVASTNADSQRKYGWWKTELTVQDLDIDSPYNSYRYAGLPPGPICNPGLASLTAAVEPTETDYLYFVAKPDGSHAFASTLDEHNANVQRYGR